MDPSSHNTKFPVLKFFAYAHLPERVQAVSRPFGQLAEQMVQAHVDGGSKDPAELAAGLRKLLEAKDCCVRAML